MLIEHEPVERHVPLHGEADMVQAARVVLGTEEPGAERKIQQAVIAATGEDRIGEHRAIAFVADAHAAVLAGDALVIDIAEDGTTAGIDAPVALVVRIDHPERAGIGEIVVGEDVVHIITKRLAPITQCGLVPLLVSAVADDDSCEWLAAAMPPQFSPTIISSNSKVEDPGTVSMVSP